MATEMRGFVVGEYTASADLSSKQYCYAKVSGVGTLDVCSASTDTPVGIIQNKPTLGQPVELMVVGVSKLVAGAAVTAGADLMPNASGFGITAATAAGANRQMGKAMTTAAGANVILEALLPGVISRI